MKTKRQPYCHIEHIELRRLLSTVFVSSAAVGNNSGTSWANAYTSLQTALGAATSGTTIEVGQGTYKPTTGASRTARFQLADGVTLQGGYAGTGQSNPDARNTTLYPTILSGDIGAAGNSDNSYQVVYARSVDNTADLDGFTITDGNANGSGNNSEGGGIFDLLAGPTINNCTISGNASGGSGAGVATLYSSGTTLTNCTLSGNTAGARGGGLYNYQSSPTVTNCTISGNTAADGGGVSDKKSSSPTLTHCIISGNTANTGGGIANYTSSPTLTDCILTGNTATENGGGIWNNDSSPALINSTISGNTAPSGNGGGMYSSFSSDPALTNCTLSGNTARYGGAIYNIVNASATLTNCIVWDDTASVTGNEILNSSDGTNTVNATNSDIDQSGFAGSNNNIDADPHFIRAVEAGGPSDFGNLRVQSNSPAIGAGNASAGGLSGITTDLDGVSRTINGHVDMGAYEARYAFQSTVFVDASATGPNTGSTWANAYSNLALALDYAVSGETIDVAQGTYYASSDASRFDTFQLVDGVSVEGGFAGLADPNAARDVSTYTTTLSGDIGTPGVIGDNTYNVVTGSGTDNTAMLDGFTITAGYASNYHPTGGGIIDFSGSPTITDSIISGNTSTGAGGGMFNYQSSPILNDCTISGNTGSSGAGMNNEQDSSPVLTDCKISGNTANQGGGGIYNDYSSPTLVSCTISGNSAADFGGGIGDDHSSPTLINCVLSGNSAVQSGGALSDTDADSLPTLTNCTLTGNSAGTTGGALYDSFSAKATLTNCILWADTAPIGNEVDNVALGTAAITFSDIDQSGFAGSNNNIDADPKFVRNVGTNGASDFGDLRLQGASPAINSGSNTAIPNGITTDLAGNNRIIGGTVDMGAYESIATHLVFAIQPPGSPAAGQMFSVTIDVDDANGDIVTTDNSNVTISLGSGSPAGASLHGTQLTAPAQNGVATFSGLSLTTAGAYTLGASDGSLVSAISSNVTVAPLAPASLIITQQPANATAGADIREVKVEVEDPYGNPTDGSSVNVSLASGPNTTLGGTTMLATSGGIASFSNLSLTDAGAYTLKFTDGSIPSQTSSSFTINPAAANMLAFVNQPVNTTADQSLAPIVVEVEDQYGNLIPSDTSNVTLTNVTTATSRTVAANLGVATFSDFPVTTAGTYTLSASDGSLTGTASNSFTVAPGAATHLVFENVPAGQMAGAVLPTFEVDVEDQDNNIVTSDDSTITLSVPGGTGTLSAIAQNGVATFSNVSLTQAQSSANLIASDGSLASATATLDIIPADAVSLVFQQQPVNGAVGSTLGNIIVNIIDAYGNLADSIAYPTTTLAIASGPSGAVLSGSTTEQSNSSSLTFSDLSLNRAGTYTLSASSPGLPTITSDSFTLNYSGPSLLFSTEPASAAAGAKLPAFTIETVDASGNLITTGKSKISLSISSGGKLIGTANAAVKNGSATFGKLSVQKAGIYTLTATDSTFASTISSLFAINAGAATKMAFTPQPSNVAHNTPFNVTVDLFDRYGNLAAYNTSTVELTLSSHPKTATFTNLMATVTDGAANFDGTILTVPGTYTLDAIDGKLKAKSGKFVVD
jgi:parallel beta-helix repeat protein